MGIFLPVSPNYGLSFRPLITHPGCWLNSFLMLVGVGARLAVLDFMEKFLLHTATKGRKSPRRLKSHIIVTEIVNSFGSGINSQRQ
jgi:hypothetical protein